MLHRRQILTLQFLAFITGFSVMVLEITVTRLLAPFFGTSLFVWTNIIAVVLAAMALGYYTGGRMARRFSSISQIAWILSLSGILYTLIPIVIPVIGRQSPSFTAILTTDLPIFLPALFFLLTALIFAIPIFVVSTLQPILVKLITELNVQVGRSSGSVSAWGTIGSIVGTIAAGYIFVPFLGSRGTLFAIATVLLVVAAVIAAAGSKIKGMAVIGMVVILALYPNLGPLKPAYGLIAERETKYQFAQVKEDDYGTRFLQFNEGAGVQTLYNPTVSQTAAYFDYYAALPYAIKNRPAKVLIVGLAGGAMVHGLHQAFGPGVQIDAVEIDGGVIDLAKKYFDLTEDLVHIYQEDARTFLNGTHAGYDLIIVDAYAQEYYIPWTLATVEFWQHVRNNLRDGGLVAMNVNAVSSQSELLVGMQNTLANVFNFTYQAKPPFSESLNYILVASEASVDWSLLERGSAVEGLFAGPAAFLSSSMSRVSYNPGSLVFTDNHAPVEFLTDKMIWDMARQ